MREKIPLEFNEEKGIIVKDTGEVVVDIVNIMEKSYGKIKCRLWYIV